jgi:predicted dehydrogenase
MNRRTFLAATAAAGLALPAAPPRLAAGFLGTAHSHFGEKHRLLKDSADFGLVGLCEDDPAVRARGPQDARWLTRDELFAAAEVVVVESAVRDHARDARQALEAGRHVHVEKPPAATLAELRGLLDLAAARRRVLQVGYMWRHNPGLEAAFAAARAGWLGEVFLVRATMNTQLAPARRGEWAEFRGGAMFEQGSHLVDAVVRLLGKPAKATPFLQTAAAHGDTLADNCVAVLEWPRALAIITSAPLQPNAGPHRFLEILGTQGTARVQPLEPPALFLDLARPAGPHPAGRGEVKVPAYARYVDEFRELAAAVRGGRPPAVTPEVELAVQETLLAACGM